VIVLESKHQLLKLFARQNIPTDNLPASNLVFLIDVSGSMSDPNKLPLLKQSLKILVNELQKRQSSHCGLCWSRNGLSPPGDEKANHN
jgi:secreted protein with Ig-like and vWFA domain